MPMKTIALVAALALSFTSASLSQTPAGGGSTEGNMNNPGSVKSNSEKGMEKSTGSATSETGGNSGAAPGASGGPSNATSGAPAGSNSGNAATGTGAAPSGK